MEIKIICDCGAENLPPFALSVFNITAYNCLSWEPDKYEIYFGDCEKCKKELTLTT